MRIYPSFQENIKKWDHGKTTIISKTMDVDVDKSKL